MAQAQEGIKVIRPPSNTDAFGYDNANYPIVVKLKPDVYVFGYEFCHVLQTLIKHGCVPAELIYGDGGALIFIFDPMRRKRSYGQGCGDATNPTFTPSSIPSIAGSWIKYSKPRTPSWSFPILNLLRLS
ncbi:hypothetical protein FDV58_27255 [Bradyrhizobium elkanii]|uniref:Uncharacterized protein n=1 Tax=Bradyrhizobium elkanii TaxID=29448 RepID=A0A4U6RVF7_BRAEL|nr:hypothetical protein [Bradyrhizobium elkanii]TKV78248.1 hypothetical protein FDV58_27255 [Bradyrhizobium elkanii]